jgi:hypothetical protein
MASPPWESTQAADPPTLWTNWCWSRGSVPDPQGQSGGPEGPAVKPRGLLTSKQRNCAYRKPTLETRFVGPEGGKVVHRVETWSTGSRYRNGVSELNPSRGILRKSESPRIRLTPPPAGWRWSPSWRADLTTRCASLTPCAPSFLGHCSVTCCTGLFDYAKAKRAGILAGYIVFSDGKEWKASNVVFHRLLTDVISNLDPIKDSELISILSEPLESNVNILFPNQLFTSGMFCFLSLGP